MTTRGFASQHLTVVGLGLMGGSVAQALRNHAQSITAVEPDPVSREYALKNKIVDFATDNLLEGVREADTVILAAPVRVITDILRKRIGSYLRSNTLLIDLGSTKHDICDAMGQLPIGVNAIGGHPMTGKENNGVTASDAMLYQNRPFVLCDTRRTTPATRERALALVEALGAVAFEMEAERHDRIVAGISHLPYILSASMVATIANEADKDDYFWQLAAGGFRDMSRLAGSDIKMMGDILSTNARAVATLLAMFRVQLAQMEAKLISGEYQELLETLLPVRQARLDWMENYESKRNGKNPHA
ncbi:MAG: prephenate dehydrogenase/arogenate dehydrogenase family protein [Anaerolineae bacterium]|nr:prephenate dehydrogenase/arogenate dehydrogenase family protein [Anaerolineae bacterium]